MFLSVRRTPQEFCLIQPHINTAVDNIIDHSAKSQSCFVLWLTYPTDIWHSVCTVVNFCMCVHHLCCSKIKIHTPVCLICVYSIITGYREMTQNGGHLPVGHYLISLSDWSMSDQTEFSCMGRKRKLAYHNRLHNSHDLPGLLISPQRVQRHKCRHNLTFMCMPTHAEWWSPCLPYTMPLTATTAEWSYSTLSLVSTGMGDHLQPGIYYHINSHSSSRLGQLSLASLWDC